MKVTLKIVLVTKGAVFLASQIKDFLNIVSM